MLILGSVILFIGGILNSPKISGGNFLDYIQLLFACPFYLMAYTLGVITPFLALGAWAATGKYFDLRAVNKGTLRQRDLRKKQSFEGFSLGIVAGILTLAIGILIAAIIEKMGQFIDPFESWAFYGIF
jgi:ABC-type Fe3+ transport system permease subunit